MDSSTIYPLQLKQLVLGALRKGKQNAIKGIVIARLAGHSDDRKVRLIIRELIAEGTPIASSVREPMGYFIVETEKEAQEYRRAVRNRVKEDCLRIRDFKRAVEVAVPPKQGVLNLA